MSIEDRPDPDEYTPDPDSVTAREEYEPEVTIDDPAREANPADVAEQNIEVPPETLTDPDAVDDHDDDE